MKKYKIDNLDCPNCASSLQNELSKQPYIQEVRVDFSTGTILLDTQDFKKTQHFIRNFKDGLDIQALKTNNHSLEHLFITKELFFLGSLLFAFGGCFLLSSFSSQLSQILLYIIYFIAGIPVFKGAYKRLKQKEIFDENFLMLFATLSAFCINADFEAVAVMLFFRVGEFFENLAVRKSRKNIQSLIDLSPSYAWKKQDNGELLQVLPEDLHVNDCVVVKAGEKIPSDGIITLGKSEVEEKALNGETMPRFCQVGDEVFGGSINLLGALEIQITKPYAQSSIAQIIALVENASTQKSQTEKRITAFAKIYTPCIFLFALLLALLPPAFGYGTFDEWFYRALVVLMVSCPCALVLSVPLGYFGGIGGASKRGVLIKGSSYLEVLAKLKMIAFDKTGTLTQGEFEVVEILPFGNYTQNEVLSIAMCAEHLSNHPIAKSLQKKASLLNQSHHPISHEQIAGKGMKAICCENHILVGNLALLDAFRIKYPPLAIQGTAIHIALNQEYIGSITLCDRLKDNAQSVIAQLKQQGIETMILSGDQQSSVDKIAKELQITRAYGELLPQNKLDLFLQYKKEKSAFIGDGINDAPVLASADIGISMGIEGSDLSKESSDVVLINDDLSKILDAIEVAKKTKAITIQNIAFALGIKGIFIFLGVFGVAGMWEAVFGDVGVSLIALLNASRVLKTP